MERAGCFCKSYFFLELPSQVKIPPPTSARAIIPITIFITAVLLMARDRVTVPGVDVVDTLCAACVSVVGKLVNVRACVGAIVAEPVGTMAPCLISRLLPG